MKLTSAPKLTAAMEESHLYRVMGVGLTDRIFLVGHSDHLPLNSPYLVTSVREAVNDLGADVTSPLLVSMLEAYFSGARDIWLVAAAPMSEYEPDLENRDTTYYETYRDRLDDTYDLLKEWDIAQITVPLEAPFNSSVDFLQPLLNYCVEAFNVSGEVHLGILGTRGLIDDNMVNAMANDSRLDAFKPENLQDTEAITAASAGKFVSIFVGDVTYHLKEMPMNHTSSAAVAVAAEMAQLPLDRGMTYRHLKNVVTTVGPDLTAEQTNLLAEAKLNAVGRNILGRRGNAFQVVPFSDNTLGQDGSDFWSLAQMRLVTVISSEIRSMGVKALGTITYDLYREEVENYLLNLTEENLIRGFDLEITRDPMDRGRVLVYANIYPYFGTREILVDVKVGPSTVG